MAWTRRWLRTSYPLVSRALARLLPLSLLAALFTGGASLEGEFEQAIFFSVSGLLAAGLFVGAQGWIRGGVATALLFVLVAVLILLAQLVPLPRAFVAGLPDRAAAFETLSILGLAPETLPISLAPDATLGGLLAFLAPLAAFCLTAAIKWSGGADLLKWTLPLLAGTSALLGLAQRLEQLLIAARQRPRQILAGADAATRR